MTIDPSATVAPQALSVKEVLEVTADSMIVGGLVHRAVTRAGIWNREDALYGRAESIMEDAFAHARDDLDMWLADMKQDGIPRFYNNEKLGTVLREIDSHYTRLFNATEDKDIEALVEELTDRNFERLLAVEV